MKGTPRPVSLKTDIIKHRNRSKGEKKIKDGHQARGKGKKGSAGSTSVLSRAPSVGSNKQSSPLMEDVEEEDDDDDQSMDELVDVDQHSYSSINTANDSPISQSSNPAIGLMNKRPRVSLEGSAASDSVNGNRDTRQPTTSRELAAAATLANGSGTNRRSVSVDGRMTPTSSLNHAPLPFNLAALFSGVISRESAKSDTSDSFRAASPSHTSVSSTSNPKLAFQPILPHHLFQQQRSSRLQPHQHQQNSLNSLPPPTSKQQQQHQYRDYSPHLVSRTDIRSLSATPTSTPQAGSRLIGNLPNSSINGVRVPSQAETARSPPFDMGLNTQTNSRFAPAALQLPASSRPLRSSSSDRLGSDLNSTPSSSLFRPSESMEEERSKQRDRLDLLFAAAGHRSFENTSGGGVARSNGNYAASPGYKPYDMPPHRSQSRIGQHTSDSRFPSILTSRSSPNAAIRSERPGSSTSSSSSSSKEGLNKGLTSFTSPNLFPNLSPPWTSIPDTVMITDELGGPANEIHSPPTSLQTISEAPSERRGRSTTRRARDGEVGETVAQELGALRMRDTSRSSNKASSYTPLSSFPDSLGASTIKTADLDDGIVRNAVTHRPISDLRASDSPSTMTLPSLSSALSSTNSSRSLSGARSGSQHSMAARNHALHEGQGASPPTVLPPPNSGFDQVARLRTRIQELEFINGLMESRVAELEKENNARSTTATSSLPPYPSQSLHGPNCACRCVDQAETETYKAAELVKTELATHGAQGLGERQSRDLFDLLTYRLGYRSGDTK